LFGLALEPQSIDTVTAQVLYYRFGYESGNNALRDIKQMVIEQVAASAGQQSEQVQVRSMLQAGFDATGKICTND